MLAVEVTDKCIKEFQSTLAYEAIYQSPTPKKLAKRIEEKVRFVHLANSTIDRAPFAWLHGLYRTDEYWEQVVGRRPIVIYYHEGDSGRPVKCNTVEAIAKTHCKILQEVNPHGPYHLGGYCAGALIAFEMAHQLLEQGKEVASLLLLEPAKSLGREESSTDDEPGERNQPKNPKSGQHHRTNRNIRPREFLVNAKRETLEYIFMLNRWQKKLQCRCYFALGMWLPPRLKFFYVEQMVHAKTFPKYKLPKLNIEIQIFYNEFGGHHFDNKWQHLSSKPVHVEMLKGSGHMDCLREPYIEKWIPKHLGQK